MIDASEVLRNIDEEREDRLRMIARQGSGAKERYLPPLLETLPGADAPSVQKAVDFAENLDYIHPGLTPTTYFAHPVRMAWMASVLVDRPRSDLITVTLLHNVLEVTELTAETLAETFGAKVADCIVALTIDRTQSGEDYLNRYYAGLEAAPGEARIVKILDKLDNLFMLCLNPDDNVRTNYLAEIEERIVPMTQRELPGLSRYLDTLVSNCRETGYTGNPYLQTAEGA